MATPITVNKLLKAVDSLQHPFTSPDVREKMNVTGRNASNNVSSMLLYFVKRGILIKSGKQAYTNLYTTPEGTTALQSYKDYLAAMPPQKGRPKRAYSEEGRKKHPMPSFPLGELFKRVL